MVRIQHTGPRKASMSEYFQQQVFSTDLLEVIVLDGRLQQQPCCRNDSLGNSFCQKSSKIAESALEAQKRQKIEVRHLPVCYCAWPGDDRPSGKAA